MYARLGYDERKLYIESGRAKRKVSDSNQGTYQT